jgi:hypothetical protein
MDEHALAFLKDAETWEWLITQRIQGQGSKEASTRPSPHGFVLLDSLAGKGAGFIRFDDGDEIMFGAGPDGKRLEGPRPLLTLLWLVS